MKSHYDDTEIYKYYSKDQLDLLNSMNPAPKVISFQDFVKYIYEPSFAYRQMVKRQMEGAKEKPKA